MLNRVVFSSLSDHWSTPGSVYSALDREFAFTFDPCPLQSRQSGVLIPWTGNVFCNPPYSKIDDFLRHGLFHLASGNAKLLVYLVPSRTDTAWFHDYCLKADEIRFIRGRLKFGDAKNSAPFPSMIVVFRKWELAQMSLEAA
jgi:hypothetical protein